MRVGLNEALSAAAQSSQGPAARGTVRSTCRPASGGSAPTTATRNFGPDLTGLFTGDCGVLGSKAKMATLMKELRNDGLDAARLRRIRTPVGLPINSRTPDEIAVSIAAEIISVKNKA